MPDRAYQASDLPAIQAQIAQARHVNDLRGVMHPGDFPHRLYNGNRQSPPEEVVHVWLDDQNQITAWVLLHLRFSAYDHLVFPPNDALRQAVIAWAESALIAHVPDIKRIEVDAYASTPNHDALWTAQGYQFVKPFLTQTRRPLTEPLPPVTLPDGFSIRTLQSLDDAPAAAAVHVGSFGSNWTPDMYRHLMQTPGYAPEREWVVVAPDGQFAAFCVIWYDTQNGIGLFEPVGTHADFRRLGLASALMISAMHHMQTIGLQWAEVCHATDNPASKGLYASMGFQPVDQIVTYAKLRTVAEG